MELSKAYAYVKHAIKQKIPVMLWGAPGIGKSSLVNQIGAENNMWVLDIRLSQVEPTDIRGVPMPNRESGRAEWFLPNFWPTPAKEDTIRKVVDKNGTTIDVPVKKGDCIQGPGIVFLDEIEKAPPSVKNASLQLVLDRMIGDYKLPNDCALVCAGNREEDNSFSTPLGLALSNRMIHFEINPDLDAWAGWAKKPQNSIAEDIIAFLYFKPDLLYKNTDEHAFPTPRSWAMASKLLAVASSQEEQRDLLASAVGRGTASEFITWNAVYRGINPSAILDGDMPDIENQNQSYKYAIALSVAFHLQKRKNGIKGCEKNLVKFLTMLGPELKVMFFKQQELSLLKQMHDHEAFKDFMKDLVTSVTSL